MARKAGRSGSQTRAMVVAAATAEIRARGVGVTLDDIATAAGVSKGGLLYHFASKEALLVELAREQVEDFRASIADQLDPTDEAPGRWTRAYIRAVLDPETDTLAAWESTALVWQLMVEPAVRDLAHQAYTSLTELLHADRLPGDLSAFVVTAADGALTPMMWGAPLDPRRNRHLRDHLIHLTLHPETWVSPTTKENPA